MVDVKELVDATAERQLMFDSKEVCAHSLLLLNSATNESSR